jgi:hypothetical protein
LYVELLRSFVKWSRYTWKWNRSKLWREWELYFWPASRMNSGTEMRTGMSIWGELKTQRVRTASLKEENRFGEGTADYAI